MGVCAAGEVNGWCDGLWRVKPEKPLKGKAQKTIILKHKQREFQASQIIDGTTTPVPKLICEREALKANNFWSE